MRDYTPEEIYEIYRNAVISGVEDGKVPQGVFDLPPTWEEALSQNYEPIFLRMAEELNQILRRSE